MDAVYLIDDFLCLDDAVLGEYPDEVFLLQVAVDVVGDVPALR
jgi:hypothetical protein